MRLARSGWPAAAMISTLLLLVTYGDRQRGDSQGSRAIDIDTGEEIQKPNEPRAPKDSEEPQEP